MKDNDYWYLEGFLDAHFSDIDCPDGAWMQRMVDGIEYLQDPKNADEDTPDFAGKDPEDVVMEFLERKAKEHPDAQTT